MVREPQDLGDLFSMIDQFHDSALLHFAHASGLFDLMAQPLDVNELVTQTDWVPRKAMIFLNALVAIGLLTKDAQSRYRNTPAIDRYLVKSRPEYIGGVVEHQRLQWDIWTRIGEVLSTRDVLPWHQEQRFPNDPAASDAFHEAMRNLARANLPMFQSLPLPGGKKHVIDLAGSHGLYLAAMAKATPDLTGEVWDLSGAERLALRTFHEFDCSDRCCFLKKDITQHASFENAHADVVMLNDCMHYFDPKTVRDVITRVVGILNPGGTLLLATQLLHEDGVSPAPAAGFSMHMMLNTSNGGLHATAWIADVMRDQGLSVSQHALDATGRYVVLLGRKNGDKM